MDEKPVIPEITFSDNKVVLAKKQVPLRVNGEDVMITLQKLPIEDKQKIVSKSATTKIVGTQVQGNIDAVAYQIALLSKVIIEAPFPTDESTIRTLPDEVVEYLVTEYETWTSNKKKV